MLLLINRQIERFLSRLYILKNFNLLSIFYLLIIISCQKQIDINPQTYLNTNEIEQLKYQSARYYSQLNEKSNHENKFNQNFDEHYKKEAKKHQLLYYFKEKNTNYEYFALTRIAPSLKIKKVAIVGKLLRKNNKIIEYEEKFRTWKMPENELNICADKFKIVAKCNPI